MQGMQMMMDLKGDEIDRCCFPSLLYCMFPGTLVVLGSCVYIVGGLGPSVDHLLSLPGHPEDMYLGRACLDLGTSHLGLGWNRVPVPNVDRIIPNCGALNGNIYCFGFSLTCPEVYDPAVGYWTLFCAPLPSHLAHCKIHNYVLPDFANNRILLHLSGGGLVEPALYVFYPDGISSAVIVFMDEEFRKEIDFEAEIQPFIDNEVMIALESWWIKRLTN
ncbi:hypothetical protein OROHE_002775 [Orobanche hederae]